MSTRRRLREVGWIVCTLLSALALYLLLEGLRAPGSVLAAFSPLLLLVAGGAVALFGWRCARRPSLSSAAGEADARADLKDELKSAYWFACQDAASAAEALMLRQAAHTVRRLDLREVFPIRMPANIAAAAALGAVALTLAFLPRDAAHSVGTDLQSAGDGKVEERAASRGRNTGDDSAFRFGGEPAPSSTPKAREERALWAKAEELARTLGSPEQRTQMQRAIQAGDVKRAQQLVDAAEEARLASPGGPAARAQTNQVSAEVAQGILERLQELLSQGDEPKREAPAQTVHDPGSVQTASREREAQEPQRPDTARHTQSEDALDDALRALSRADAGERQAERAQGQSSQDNGRTNINGGAMGVRVDVSQVGPGGEDTPPNSPSEGGEPVLGKPTLRLAAQLQHLGAGAVHNDPDPGTREAFYAATRAQAARLDFAAAEAAAGNASEMALMRKQVPVAYRASVKRYFLIEHAKER